jgi:hypothetical protein
MKNKVTPHLRPPIKSTGPDKPIYFYIEIVENTQDHLAVLAYDHQIKAFQ